MEPRSPAPAPTQATAPAPSVVPAPSAGLVSAPGTVRLAGRFRSAARALVFAGQVEGLGWEHTLSFARSKGTGTWWAVADAPLDVGVEMVAAVQGTAFVRTSGVFKRVDGAETAPRDLVATEAVELVRVSGLQQIADPAQPADLVVLAPGRRVASLVQRALDLGLEVGYRITKVEPLFPDTGSPDTGSPDSESLETRSVLYEIVLHSRTRIPPAFLTALGRDPFVLACRRIGPALHIQHQTASALPARQLAALAARECASGSWVLADAAFGCHRLLRADDSPLHDGADLVRLSDAFELADDCESPGFGQSEGDDGEPDPPPLRVVPAPTRGVAVDAVLLDDADLSCVAMLLEGQPLADIALLARGRDRHMLLAPGGLLERLAVGEYLHRIGPGPLYLPLGHRLRPALPPTARRKLFPATDRHAIVLIDSDHACAFDLTTCVPVWTLWAGPMPAIDLQVPPEALDVLAAVAEMTSPPALRPAQQGPTVVARNGSPIVERSADPPPTWREQAWDAEREGDLVRAAELHEANHDLRRAAHLYELAAREQR